VGIECLCELFREGIIIFSCCQTLSRRFDQLFDFSLTANTCCSVALFTWRVCNYSQNDVSMCKQRKDIYLHSKLSRSHWEFFNNKQWFGILWLETFNVGV